MTGKKKENLQKKLSKVVKARIQMEKEARRTKTVPLEGVLRVSPIFSKLASDAIVLLARCRHW